jgi:diacylglycerol O-acyltransferase / wax synthase
MKQLSSLDATFLYLESPEMPMHVGSLNIYELPAGFRGSFVAHLRRHMASRLPLLPVLRRRLWWMPLNLANPAWVDAEPDLRQHIVSIKLPPSAKVGDGMAEMESVVGELHSVLLDRSRPLWKFFVLEGLAPSANGCKRVGLYSQLHHAAVDGIAAVAVAQALLDTTPEGRVIEARPSKRNKVFRLGMGQMLRGALASEAAQVAGIIRGLPSTLGTLADAAGQALGRSNLLRRGNLPAKVSNLTLAPRTVFNHSVGTRRTFAGVSLPLAELKALGKSHEATLNDIVLVLCSTALRRYLAKRGELPRKSLIAGVPVSLRVAGDTTSDTQASMSLVSLGTHVADLRKRIEHVKAASAAMKAAMGSVKSVLPTDFPSIGVPWLVEAVAALYGKARVADRIPQVTNLTISNVPGPPVPLYLAGARMLANYPTSIVVHGIGLNITVESYDRQMDFGIVGDATALPDPRALADAIRIAYDDLLALQGQQAQDEAPPLSMVAAGRSALGRAQRLADAVGGVVKGAVNEATSRVVKAAMGGTARQVGTAVSKVTRAARPGGQARAAAKPAPKVATRTAARRRAG